MNRPNPSPEAVRAELEQILQSPQFRDAGRLGPFLRHLVERTLAGDDSSLKESLLGTEFFQRGSDYDPRTDPVVRVEARRLRQRLEDYYGGAGTGSGVRVTLPKGGYVPVFETLGDERAKTGRPDRVRFVIFAAVAAAANNSRARARKDSNMPCLLA